MASVQETPFDRLMKQACLDQTAAAADQAHGGAIGDQLCNLFDIKELGFHGSSRDFIAVIPIQQAAGDDVSVDF